MNAATMEHTRTAEAPFEAVRRRLLGADGGITHAGNIGYTFGGGGMGVLATRFGMAAGRPAGRVRPDCSRAVRKVNSSGV
jgi:hypothetical protein